MESFMLPQTEQPQTEDRRQIELLPSNHAGAGKRPRKSWLVLTIAAGAGGAPLVSGLWFPGQARTTLNRGTRPDGLPRALVWSPKKTAADAVNNPAGDV